MRFAYELFPPFAEHTPKSLNSGYSATTDNKLQALQFVKFRRLHPD